MTGPFSLHPNFQSKIFLVDLPLCKVLMEDEKRVPWLMLIPRRLNAQGEAIERLMELEKSDQHQLLDELDAAQKTLWAIFKPDQLNLAQIGNKTRQLHIHVVGRFVTDHAWPNTVWDFKGDKEPYSVAEKLAVVEKLKSALKI